MRGKREPLADRFWQYVTPCDGCWNWQGALFATGYARLGHGSRAHRTSYEIHNGPIPKGSWVLHKCDNRRCVNPEHLYLGDRSQNMKDAHERKRIDLSYVASFPRPGRRK